MALFGEPYISPRVKRELAEVAGSFIFSLVPSIGEQEPIPFFFCDGAFGCVPMGNGVLHTLINKFKVGEDERKRMLLQRITWLRGTILCWCLGEPIDNDYPSVAVGRSIFGAQWIAPLEVYTNG